MRGRHRFLVAYDIADSKRLRRVHKTTKEFGWPMQYSVFISDLDAMELNQLRMRLSEVIHHREDSIAIINVGLPDSRGLDSFEFLGVQPVLPSSEVLIL